MDSDENDDPLSKVRPIIDLLIGNIRSCYYPDQNLSLVESMMARQYIKGKKEKFGIKLYALCETTGFVLNFVIYEGKSTMTKDDEGDVHCQKIVIKLMQPYFDKSQGLYIDNFYNSVGLSELLHNRKTHIIRILRANRKDNPKSITQKKLKKPGEACWMRRGPVYMSKWKDKREILMLSTKHHHRIVNCTSSRGHNKLKPIRVFVHDYNTNMEGVDCSDQLRCYCSTPWKTIKWYKKVFFHLLNIAVMNSYVLFKKLSKQKKLRILMFRDVLIGELVSVDLGMEQPMKTSGSSITLAEYETVDAFHS